MNYIYHRSICSDLEDIKIIMGEIIRELGKIINDEDLLFDIRLILNELVVNSAIHGNKCNRDKLINLFLEIKGNILRIKVMDEGQGIDYDIKSYNPKDLKCCGRGLVIVSGLSDKCHIEKNKIEVVKYIS